MVHKVGKKRRHQARRRGNSAADIVYYKPVAAVRPTRRRLFQRRTNFGRGERTPPEYAAAPLKAGNALHLTHRQRDPFIAQERQANARPPELVQIETGHDQRLLVIGSLSDEDALRIEDS